MKTHPFSSKLRLGLTLLAPFCTASLALAIGMTNIPQPARALQSSLPANSSLTASEIRSTANITSYVHLPIVMKGGCAPMPGETYGTLAPTNPRTDNVEEDHLINLARRGYEPVDKFKGLIDNGLAGDPLAPQFPGLFADNRTGVFSHVYALHKWDLSCNCPSPELVTNPEVTVAGLAATPGETIYVPDSGYDIGGGNDVMVLYAGETRLTLKYTREDDIVQGYTLYLEKVCVEPGLLALYRSLNAAGRGQLPALPGGQAVGRAMGSEIGIAIRDSGTSQDPRSRNSWWIGR